MTKKLCSSCWKRPLCTLRPPDKTECKFYIDNKTKGYIKRIEDVHE